MPTIVATGHNEMHPEHSARKLHALMPNSRWVGYPVSLANEEARFGAVSRSAYFAFLSPYYDKFLAEVESGTFEADRK